MQKLCSVLALAIPVFVAACGSDSSGGGSGGTGGSAGAAGGSGSAGAAGSGPTMVGTAKGSLSATVTNTNPVSTCSYTLELDGVEDDSQPWQCPTCKTTYRSNTKLSAGEACYTQLSGGALPASVAFGWDPNGTLRIASGFSRMNVDFGVVNEAAGSANLILNFSITSTAPVNTTTYSGSGTLTLGTTAAPADEWQPSSSYSCGWAKSTLAPYTASYQPKPKTGAKLPDGVFTDQCGDKVRLQDLLGKYLVIQAQQTNITDCGPCTQGAAAQKQFEDDMAALNIPTLVVSLLVPDYAAAGLTPQVSDMTAWVSQYSTTGVALADRGYGQSVLGSWTNLPDFGYPSYMLVAPDGTILSVNSGWGAGPPSTFDQFKTEIQADAGK